MFTSELAKQAGQKSKRGLSKRRLLEEAIIDMNDDDIKLLNPIAIKLKIIKSLEDNTTIEALKLLDKLSSEMMSYMFIKPVYEEVDEIDEVPEDTRTGINTYELIQKFKEKIT